MKWQALATDYDGTIAFEGQVDALTLAALQRARTQGLRLILVTGRELSDLSNIFAHSALFDRIVAENGAVLQDPEAASLRTLAPAPPPGLLAALTARAVPISVGHSIVATAGPYEGDVRETLRDLGLDWHLVFNKGSVMVLPKGVSKSTGLAAALAELRVSPSRVVGVGDAENDIAFLEMCGLSVAVANALPAVRQAAAFVTQGAQGAGVAELIERLLSGAC